MQPRRTALTLLLPGLLGPHTGPDSSPEPRTPSLLRLLTRARDEYAPAADYETRLCRLFGLATAAPPVAALTRLADGGPSDEQPLDEPGWLRADPVHLHADLHRVRLFDARMLSVTTEEATALAAAFNAAFSGDGLQLDARHPQRWYLHADPPPTLATTPLPAVTGHDITPLLPTGPDQRRWRMLLTECQMLFHDHPVNRSRERRGQAPINGVWLWGEGVLPALSRPSFALYADDALSRGLARCTDLALQPLPDNALDWCDAAGDEPAGLIVFEGLRYPVLDGDPDAWSQALETLEHDWFRPLERLLRGGQLGELRLLDDYGAEWRIGRRDLLRFWRRSHPLSHWRHR